MLLFANVMELKGCDINKNIKIFNHASKIFGYAETRSFASCSDNGGC